MSYEIVYDRLAIKVAEDKYLLLLQAGSNNCCEVVFHVEIPEKNWFVYPVRNRADAPYITMAEFEKQIALEARSFVNEHGYFETTYKTRNRPWEAKAFFSWLRTAMRKAETVEEISKRFYIDVVTRVDSEKVFVNNATIKTTKDLVDYIENAKNLDGFVSINWHLPRKITHPRKNPQNVKKVSSFYVLKDRFGWCYVGKMANRIRCAKNLDFAKKFGNEAMVKRYIAKYNLQDRGFDVIERVEAEAYI